MSQFKAGDLALMVNSTCSENIGKTVRLVEFTPVGGEPQVGRDIYTARLHPSWVVETLDGAKTLVVRRVSGEFFSVNAGVCREAWLMPLRGDFQHEQQKSREVVE